MMKKIFAGVMLAFPFALLLTFAWAISVTPGEDYLGDLKDFVRSSSMDMRGKIEAPPDYELGEPVTFGGGGCKPQSVFSSQRLKHQD